MNQIPSVNYSATLRFIIHGFASIALLTAATSEELKTHHIDGIVEFQAEKKWLLENMDPIFKNDTILWIGTLSHQKNDPGTELIMHVITEPPRQTLLSLSHKSIATKVSDIMSLLVENKGANKTDKKLGEVIITPSKSLGKDYHLFERNLALGKGKQLKLHGVVWKTHRRAYSFISFVKDQVPPESYWEGLLKNWKELTSEEKIYSDIYRLRSKFLTKEQQSKLPEVLKSEMASSLELSNLFKEQTKRASPAAKKKYLRQEQITYARNMRLIYHKLLTNTQRGQLQITLKQQLKK